jgi:hypothetical protein
MKSGMLTRTGIAVTGITDETETAVRVEEDGNIRSRTTDVLLEKATRMYQLGLVQVEIRITKLLRTTPRPLCPLPPSQLQLQSQTPYPNRPPLLSLP